MSYYPKSQIKTNLYTNGEEYVIINTEQFYTGYYYEISTGRKFIGKIPNSTGRTEITPVADDILKTSLDNPNAPPTLSSSPSTEVINLVGLDLVNDESLLYYDSTIIFGYPHTPNFKRRIIPPSYYSQPTPEEEEIGEYQRYFAKKTNELIYIEISKETYTKFKDKDPTTAFDLYECLSLPWDIIDSEVNFNIAKIIEKDNNWYGFTFYFQGNFG